MGRIDTRYKIIFMNLKHTDTSNKIFAIRVFNPKRRKTKQEKQTLIQSKIKLQKTLSEEMTFFSAIYVKPLRAN